MGDILKSGLLGIALIVTLVFSAPILNDDDENSEIAVVPESTELEMEKDIHIPL